jgi:hypothetical protein
MQHFEGFDRMNKNDKEFLYSMADARIQFHYASHLDEIRPDKGQYVRLEERFQAAVRRLDKQDQEAVQAYLEYLFRKSAVTEQVLYRAGVADGYKLAGLVRRLE